jgi:hypothetical protein
MKNKLYKINILLFLTLISMVSCDNEDAFSLEGYPDAVVNNDPPGAPARGLTEGWNNHDAELTRKHFDTYTAVYYGDEVNREMIWPYTFFSSTWQYVLDTYGDFGNEEAYLYAVIHQDLDTQAYYSTYFNEQTSFRSLIDFSVNGIEESAENLDLAANLISAVVENSAHQTLGSPAHAIWQDKFSELFRYDLYTSLERMDHAKRIHDAAIAASSNFPSNDTYWFRDWFLPLYENYNGIVVFNNFFKILSQNYKKNGEAYAGEMNMGEFVHFFSGASGEDLKAMAETAFGWNDQWETELLQARTDYPNLNYPFDPTSIMIDLTSDATLTVSKENGDGAQGAEGSLKLVDNNLNTKFLVGGLPSEMELWMQQQLASAQAVNRYTITSGNDAPDRDPTHWELQGSNDASSWVTLDSRTEESFSGRNQTREFIVENQKAYSYYRLFITKNGGSDAVQLSEWRLLSLELIDPSLPVDLSLQSTLSVSHENADGAQGPEGSLKLIDRDTSTKYLASFEADFWLQQSLETQRIVGHYTLTSGNDAPDRDPMDWELQGSNDGVSWEVIDTRNGETFTERNLTQSYTVQSTTAYLHYRLSITANNGGSAFQLSEWRIYE